MAQFEFPEYTPFSETAAAKATEAVTVTLTLGQLLVLSEALVDWQQAEEEDGDDAEYLDFLVDTNTTISNQLVYWAKKHGYTELAGLPIR